MMFALAIHKDAESDYGVTVLDLPGCFSAGETIDDAISQAQEAVECHLEAMLEAGEALPNPKSIEFYKNHEEAKDAVFAYINVDLNRLAGPSERINITIPKLILRKMDIFARKASVPRSTFIANAALEYMQKHAGDVKSKI